MERRRFEQELGRRAKEIEAIRRAAHELHERVNQTYDKVHPYGFHLDMVADGVRRFGHTVCENEEDVLPLMFGAYYHDSIEDARQTYNDVRREALRHMNEEQAVLATEIVYALTNEKGRTRSERAGERYYQGIRETPYAPLVKLADRLANATYSFRGTNEANNRMREVYVREMPHFLAAISAQTDDPRLFLPADMLAEIRLLVKA